MSKLREKLVDCAIMNESGVDTDTAIEILEDFAIKFAEWKDSNITELNYSYINSTEELLQIFKENYYD